MHSKNITKAFTLSVILAGSSACQTRTYSQTDSARDSAEKQPDRSLPTQADPLAAEWLDPAAKRTCLVFAEMHSNAVDPDADGQNVSHSLQKNQIQDTKIRYALARDPMAKSSMQLFAIIDAGFANATYAKIESGAISEKWNVPPSKRGIGFSLVSAPPSKEVIPLREKVLNRDELTDLSSLPPFLSAPGNVLGSYTAAIAKQKGPKGIQEYFRYSNMKSPFPDYLEVQKNLEVNISDSNERQSLSPLEFLATVYLKKQYPIVFSFASNNLPQKNEEVDFSLVPASATRARLFITRFTKTGHRTKGYELVCQSALERPND